jgi:type I restriction enzyme S subunit
MKIIFPPLKEQQKIANYLDKKTKTIDTLIEKSTQAIELLKERRTALISAVVTGKVDVRSEDDV